MEKRAPINRFAAFLVIFLLVMLPVSVSAQLSAASASSVNEEKPALASQEAASYYAQGATLAEPQAFCIWPWKDCKNKCSACGFGNKWYCSSSGAVCCASNAKFCDGSNGKCWSDCPAGQKWNCGSSGAYCTLICTDKDGDGYGSGCSKGSDCNDNDGSVYKNNVCGKCAKEPAKYGDSCTVCKDGCCATSKYACDNSGTGVTCPVTPVGCCIDKDGDGYGSGCGKGNDCNDNDAGVYKSNVCGVCAKDPAKYGKSCTVCNGACCATSAYDCNNAGTGVVCPVTPKSPSSEICNNVDDDCDGSVDEGVKNACGGCGAVPAEVCNDGKDNDCDGSVDEGCCPSDKPHFWGGSCHACQQDFPNKCGNNCWKCNNPADSGTCSNGQFKCCPSGYPSYCGRTNSCWKSSTECGNAQKCGNEDWSVCRNQAFPKWNCLSTGKSLCCPNSYPYYWESDKQCHTTLEPKKCSVPDGSSANCDCDTDSECAKADSSKPYCGETYGKRESSGFHACLSAKPEYCGNGKCGSGEDYKNCPNDCASPSGILDVYVNRGIIPIQGAKVYVDGSLKGVTDIGGKVLVNANQGQRMVKVECPDSSACDVRNVLLKDHRYVNFACWCKLDSDSDDDGYIDGDEIIIGTDPKDPASHLPDEPYVTGLAGCVISPVQFALKWKSLGGDKETIIQSTESVVQALNVTSVTSSSIDSNTHALAAALMQADLPAQVIENPKGLTLNNSVLAAEYMTGIIASDGLILIATDNQTGTTTLIEVGADCLGILVGLGYGFGQGAVDEIKGGVEAVKVLVPAIGRAVWLYFIHNDKFNEKLYNGVRELVKAVYDIHRERNALGWKLVMSIFEKGQRVNVFKESWIYPNKGAYEKFQYGFYSGYLTGYVSELIISAIFGPKILSAFTKGTLIAVKAGVRALENLRLAVVEKLRVLGFTENIIKTTSKLPYFDAIIQTLSEAEVNILGKLTKIDSGWAKGMKEEEALRAIKNYDKVVNADKLITEAQMEKLLSTNLGRETIKLSETTPELLAKQSKLVEKWGTDTVNKVTKKSFFSSYDPERVDGLRKIWNTMPEGLADQFTQAKAVKLLGKKGFGDAIEKVYASFTKSELENVVKGIGDFENVGTGAEKVLKYRSDFSFSKFTNNFPSRLETMNDLGKLENVKGADKLAHDIALNGLGHPHAARRAVILKETPGVKLLEIGKETIVKIKYQGNEFVEILEMDVFYERQVGNKVIKVIEEVASKETNVIGSSEKIEKQILKMTKALEMGLADEAKLVTKGTFDIDVTRFIAQNGNKVQLVPEGIK